MFVNQTMRGADASRLGVEEDADKIRINVLGPFEVFRDDRVVTPSAKKPCRALALLAMNANQVIGRTQLMEELWEHDAPARATTTLQTYIYQLRKTCVDRSMLHTVRDGYLLSLPARSLDAARFAELAKRGMAQAKRGELETSLVALRGALSLWRGPVLADVSAGPILEPTLVRLDELRKGVLEQRIDVELQLGRHQELLGELAGLAASQPTHEGFHAKLILALYRCGRRSDALAAYQRARALLAEELGLEPSASLRLLHQAVLSADPALDADSPAGGSIRLATAARSVRQLPPDVPGFVGRQAQIEHVRRVVGARHSSAPPLIVAAGPPGSGKSAFCVHLAHQLQGAYPDGQLYLELGQDKDAAGPAELLGRLLRAVGVPDERIPDSLAERIRTFRSWSADRAVLVVLDDAEGTSQIEPFLPTGPDCLVLVSSRCRLFGPRITANVRIEPLAQKEGIEFLAGLVGLDRIRREPGATRELLDLCHGLPLALREAASQLQLRSHWSIGRQVRHFREHPESLWVLAEAPVFDSVARTYRLLSEEARAAFHTIAAESAPVAVSSMEAASLLGIGEPEAEFLLEDLVRYHLAEALPMAESRGASFYYRLRLPYGRFAAELAHDGTDDQADHSPPDMTTRCGISAR
jgi:DNA-binding SARP family transcriptional activator